MVSVTTRFWSGDSWMRLMAGPDRTGWVIAAATLVAPALCSASAASVSVPAVSTMSSTMTQCWSVTSPMMFITWATFRLLRGACR